MTSANGQFDTINAGKLIGKALADALAPALAQLSQPRMCAVCLAKRIPWEKANRAAVETAMAAAQTAAANGQPVDFAEYLPERLRAAGVPAVNMSVTSEQGTEKCAEHVSGVQGGGAPLLAATVGMPPGALGQPAR